MVVLVWIISVLGGFGGVEMGEGTTLSRGDRRGIGSLSTAESLFRPAWRAL